MKKILAVALSNEVLTEIKQQLDPSLLSLHSVLTVKEAYNQINQNKYTLILLGNLLPDMEDYRDFCLKLKSLEETSKIPVILFAFASEKPSAKIEVLRSCLVNDYFGFPISLEEIVARLNIFIEIRLLQEELEAKNAVLKRLSITDDLTKIYNRRHLMERLTEEVTCMKRYKYSISCLMADIDYFKKINDKYGHPMGDQVLKQLASLFKTNIRSVDILSRYGGEEFMIILPFTGKDGVRIVGERLRSTVMAHVFPGGEEPLKITISVGAATFSHVDPVDVNEVIKVVDSQMYQAKMGGRNRVSTTVYSELNKSYTSSGESLVINQ
ncbi:MAG: diguanylate cyclase [Candidatus Omnitrophica bacterium]|nr:diguanylate cyclase [Candidatus Omnitrophota bacterium]